MDVVLDTVFFEDTDTVDAVERREAEEGVFLARGLSLAESGISAQYLQAAVQALEVDGVEAVVKVSAVKTLRKYVVGLRY